MPAATLPERSGAAEAATADLLVLDGLTKHFGRVKALTDVSLRVAAGEVHCLLGENGAGKSTLCNLVFGVHQPDQGQMWFGGAPYRPGGPAEALRSGIAMVHQHFSLVPNMTVVENILLGQGRGMLDRAGCAARVAQLAEEYGLGVHPTALISDMPVGERQRVEIIKCLIRSPRLLVLDEPTAVLLPEEIDTFLTVCQRVAERGCGVVLVTHKLAEIKRIANRVTVLRGGRTVATSSNPARDISALVRAMVQRDLDTLDVALAGTLGLAEGEAEPAAEPDVSPAPRVARDEALQIDGLSVRDAANVLRVDALTLTVDRGEIVGLAGVEGNGQTEIGLVLAGLLRPSAGRVFIGGQESTTASPRQITDMGAGIVPEDRHAVGCITAMSVAENMYLNRLARFARFGLLRRGAMEQSAADLMQRFDVRADGPRAPFSSLSGGNQQKAVLARELTTQNLLFLLAAQPTRGLDVGAVEAVYKSIREACAQGVGCLLISSELDELIAVADRIVVLYRGRIIGTRPAKPRYRDEIGALMAGHSA